MEMEFELFLTMVWVDLTDALHWDLKAPILLIHMCVQVSLYIQIQIYIRGEGDKIECNPNGAKPQSTLSCSPKPTNQRRFSAIL